MSTMITGASQISLYQLLVLKSAIKLEILGMKRRSKSAYTVAKLKYGFKGNKVAVLKQVEAMIKQAQDASTPITGWQAENELAEGDTNE